MNWLFELEINIRKLIVRLSVYAPKGCERSLSHQHLDISMTYFKVYAAAKVLLSGLSLALVVETGRTFSYFHRQPFSLDVGHH